MEHKPLFQKIQLYVVHIIAKIKHYIKKHFPKFFVFLKTTPAVLLSKIVFHARERFDPLYPEVEVEYFEAYTKEILYLIKRAQGTNLVVLDIGCGYGYATNLIAEFPAVSALYALDKITPRAFRFSHNPKITFIQTDLTKPLEGNIKIPEVDIAVSTEFIEHIAEKEAVQLIRGVYTLLKSGGMFVGTTPINRTNLKQYSGSPFHEREYAPDDFKKLLIECGFENIIITEHLNFFVWQCVKNNSINP